MKQQAELDATVRAITLAHGQKKYGELHKQARRLMKLSEPLTPFAIAWNQRKRAGKEQGQQ